MLLRFSLRLCCVLGLLGCRTSGGVEAPEGQFLQSVDFRIDTGEGDVSRVIQTPPSSALVALNMQTIGSQDSHRLVFPRSNRWNLLTKLPEDDVISIETNAEIVSANEQATVTFPRFVDLAAKTHRRILQGQYEEANVMLEEMNRDFGAAEITVALRLLSATVTGQSRQAQYLKQVLKELKP